MQARCTARHCKMSAARSYAVENDEYRVCDIVKSFQLAVTEDQSGTWPRDPAGQKPQKADLLKFHWTRKE
eukprot:6186013-Pleurochrysis_carterae.AAC.6